MDRWNIREGFRSGGTLVPSRITDFPNPVSFGAMTTSSRYHRSTWDEACLRNRHCLCSACRLGRGKGCTPNACSVRRAGATLLAPCLPPGSCSAFSEPASQPARRCAAAAAGYWEEEAAENRTELPPARIPHSQCLVRSATQCSLQRRVLCVRWSCNTYQSRFAAKAPRWARYQ